MSDLFTETNSLCLRFDSQDDAINFASDCGKKGNRWLAANSIDFAKRYKEGDIEIVLKLRVGPCGCEHYLVLLAIPNRSGNGTGARNGHMFDVHSSGCHANGNNDSVFAGVASAVKCPNEIVASLVRVERAKERNDVRRDIFAATINHFVQFSSRTGNGEVGGLGVFDARNNGGGKSCLVECGTEPLYCLGGNTCDASRKFLGEFDLVNIVEPVIISLDNAGVWFCVKETLDPTIKIANVFFCARDTHPGAGEGVLHEPSNVEGNRTPEGAARREPTSTAGWWSG